jgi:hypothetical protein
MDARQEKYAISSASRLPSCVPVNGRSDRFLLDRVSQPEAGVDLVDLIDGDMTDAAFDSPGRETVLAEGESLANAGSSPLGDQGGPNPLERHIPDLANAINGIRNDRHTSLDFAETMSTL